MVAISRRSVSRLAWGRGRGRNRARGRVRDRVRVRVGVGVGVRVRVRVRGGARGRVLDVSRLAEVAEGGADASEWE